ncbi:DUF2924 domain-containing protein [Erythrobacter sp. YT30]|uniref:DUF2924 domain-containing protein n=1 Tax=Erythrobacter sp. YT30 TaxID=1735012 RepID=UPI00076D84E3|nr:DUF2924 domain-containing protein [Erythrobacter sp. YT30]KWV92028.1 hypothetical protein AUC45_12810 [Erythrobacter sp. YT30]
MSDKVVGDNLASLETMSLHDLRKRWATITSSPVPRLSAAMLRLALAWELQAQAFGGLSRRTQQQLEQAAKGKTKTDRITSGMRLVREWNGTVHVVTIDDEGAICWSDQSWNSLSQVAKAITGTHWSGPAFFGLKTRAAA